MAKDYLTRHYDPRTTVQTEAIPGREDAMKQNEAGGYGFKLDVWGQLDRFLVLGSKGGTYYANEHKLTLKNAKVAARCIKADGVRVVNRVVEMSDQGRIPKNDTALFVHAMASVQGNDETRRLAHQTLNKVARIGTHLFHWVEYREMFGGWGTGVRKAVQHWYLDKAVDKLAYQMIKYRQRDGWSHFDMLRLAHVKPATPEQNALFGYAKAKSKGEKIDLENLPAQVVAAERIMKEDMPEKQAIELIINHRLPFEALPKPMLKNKAVWEALLENMPMTAMIRNLGKMTNIDLLKPMSNASNKVITELANQERITKARVHPIQILSAMLTYRQGHGFRGNLTWTPVPDVLDALDKAFYLSFGNVKPTGKKILIGVDVSGSMTWGTVAGIPGLTPNFGAAALSLITKATENTCHIMGFSHKFIDLGITPRMRLDEVARKTQASFGATDCALPMLWALKNKVDADVFIVITDNQTWYGDIHPTQALNKYRRETGIPAKLIVIGMTATNISIADPKDAGMMNIAGFDTAAPNIINDFIRGD